MLLKRQYIIIFFLVALAIAGSFMLIPGQQELALMAMKDKNFDAARSAYEKEVTSGSITLEVANNLSDLYLQKGEIKKAIEIMEKFVTANPNNLQGRIKLGRLYQFDQRTDDYTHNLEAINNLKPSSENLDTLSDIYNYKGDYEKQEQTLKNMIAFEKGQNPKHYSDLANIQASQHDYAGAISTLHEFQKLTPNYFTFANEMLLVSLLFDEQKPDEATQTAGEWLDSHNNDDEVSDLVNMVHYKGGVTPAENLINHYSQDKLDSMPRLLEASVLLKLSENKDDEVYKHLRSLHDAKKLPPALSGDLLLLSVQRSDRNATHELMKEIPLDSLPEEQVLRLINGALVQDDPVLLAYITSSFQSDEAKTLYPVITAALAVANQSSNAPALLSHLDILGFSHEKTLEIATICAHFERNECTHHLIDTLPDQTKLSDSEVATVGDIYLQMHEVNKGYSYIHKAQETRHSSAIEHTALRLSAARGQEGEIQAWIDSHPNEATPNMLGDLFYGAYDTGNYSTAVHIAKIYQERYNNDTARSLLANAYVASKQYEQAIKVLRENNLHTRSNQDESNYLVSLTKLASKNPQYRNELVAYANTKLHSDSLSEKQRLELLHTLIDNNETDAAMPYIGNEAMTRGGEWTILYAQLLDKKGRHEEASRFWKTALNDPTLPSSKKEEIAYVLLDNGDKMDAEPVFAELADHADAHSNAIKELMYIWGPKPALVHLQWLEKRYEAATETEKRRWAVLISDAASPDYIQGFVSRHPASIQVPEVADAYFDAQSSQGTLAGKSVMYADEARKTGNTVLLSQYAKAARAAGLKKDARDAYQALINLKPNNYVALREAGTAAFDDADYGSAKTYLGKYITNFTPEKFHDPKAYEAYFYYAEILRRDEEKDNARTYYRRTLVLMENTPETVDNINIKAQSQIWSDNVAAGMKTMDSALGQYPDNGNLRREFVNNLIELGQYDKARTLLNNVQNGNAPQNAKTVTSTDLPSFVTPIRNVTPMHHNHELLITFTKKVNVSDINKLRNLPWVSYTSDGYDSVLVSTLPEYKFHINSNTLHLSTDKDSNEPPVDDTPKKAIGE